MSRHLLVALFATAITASAHAQPPAAPPAGSGGGGPVGGVIRFRFIR